MFLDILFGKLRPNVPSGEDLDTEENKTRRKFLADGYRWASRCGSELNFIKADWTPIVYQALCLDSRFHVRSHLHRALNLQFDSC